MLATLADRQHGVVARRQLPLSDTIIRNRVRSGHLIRMHRGVYAVGHARLRREGVWLAAVLSLGDGAALSHRDAAALHDIRSSNGTRIDVTVPGPRRGDARIRAHRVRALDPADTTRVDGIPVTTVARTLVDLAAILAHDHLARAINEAERRGLLDIVALDAARDRVRNRPGTGHTTLTAALADHTRRGLTLAHEGLEDRFPALVEAHGLPRPATNVHTDAGEVDALWPDARVAIELDGWEFHRTRRAFQHDRTKGNALALAGWTVLRFTHADVMHDGARVIAELRRALGPS